MINQQTEKVYAYEIIRLAITAVTRSSSGTAEAAATAMANLSPNTSATITYVYYKKGVPQPQGWLVNNFSWITLWNRCRLGERCATQRPKGFAKGSSVVPSEYPQ